MSNNFPKVSDAFDANRLNRGGKDPSEDPRRGGDGLDVLTVWGLQELCAAHGMPEALGEGKPVKGDSTEWSAEKCKRKLRADGITAYTPIPKKAAAITPEMRAAPSGALAPKKNKGGRPKKTVAAKPTTDPATPAP